MGNALGTWVAGVDGCRAGWVVVLRELATRETRARLVATFAEVLRQPEHPRAIGIDIPIGLPEVGIAGGREGDRMARALLGPRAASVFSPPSRRALRAFERGAAYAQVNAVGGPRISLQSFHLLPKIAEVDGALTRARQRSIREVHPELSFAEANGGAPMKHPKKTAAGQRERRALLRRLGFPALRIEAPRSAVQPDDILDAAIVCWTAERIACGAALALPARAVRDPRGLRMEIVR